MGTEIWVGMDRKREVQKDWQMDDGKTISSRLYRADKDITASDMVAENNIVCLVLEHILITSFICSAKYSSNIL